MKRRREMVVMERRMLMTSKTGEFEPQLLKILTLIKPNMYYTVVLFSYQCFTSSMFVSSPFFFCNVAESS